MHACTGEFLGVGKSGGRLTIIVAKESGGRLSDLDVHLHDFDVYPRVWDSSNQGVGFAVDANKVYRVEKGATPISKGS